jgi:exonuclease VII small subunit
MRGQHGMQMKVGGQAVLAVAEQEIENDIQRSKKALR